MCSKRALANLRHEQGPKLIALAGAKGFESVARTLRGDFGHGHLSRTVLPANGRHQPRRFVFSGI
jgi:hypothetical protein